MKRAILPFWAANLLYDSFAVVQHNGKVWRSERRKDLETQALPLELNINKEPKEGSLFWIEVSASVAE